MNRTGSISSRVPPAETRTRRPLRSLPVCGCEKMLVITAKISAGSGSRPGPLSFPASLPTAGSITTAPRSRSVVTLACVAGCSHISVCIAGANTTGQVAISKVAVSRSPAIPAAARAIRSAVAGTTAIRSASWPSFTCGASAIPVHTSVRTGSPDSPAQVASPTKRSASLVGTTLTRWPASVSRRSSSPALYAEMPAPTPRTTRAGIAGSRLDGLDAEQPALNLAQRDGQRLLLAAGLHQWPDVLQQALAELGVVGVDLTCTLRGHDDQPVLAVHDIKEFIDRRVNDAFRDLIACHVPPSLGRGYGPLTGPRHMLLRHQGYQLVAHVCDRRVHQRDVDLAARGQLLLGSRQPARDDLRWLGPPAGQPPDQLVPGWRGQEHHMGVWRGATDLPRAGQIDLKQARLARLELLFYRSARSAGPVRAMRLGPLQQLPICHHAVELFVSDKVVVAPVDLPGARLPRGGRDRLPDLGIAAAELGDDRALPDP